MSHVVVKDVLLVWITELSIDLDFTLTHISLDLFDNDTTGRKFR